MPTKKTITKPGKSGKLKTKTKTNPYLKAAGQIGEVADFWDSLQIKIAKQICEELGFDPSVFKSVHFKDLSQKLQEKIVNDYKNFLDDKTVVSETLDSAMQDLDISSLTNFKPSKKKILKNIKVTCWHCDNPDQKIKSFEEAFDCDKCGELLWIGDGGFEEIKVGVYK